MPIRKELEEMRSFWGEQKKKRPAENVGLFQRRNPVNRDYDKTSAFGLRRRGNRRYKRKTEFY